MMKKLMLTHLTKPFNKEELNIVNKFCHSDPVLPEGSGIKLYTLNAEPDCAYFLSNGSVFLYASNMDKYAIKGQNLIVGSTELIMNHLLKQQTMRIETAIASRDSSQKIPADKFISGMETFSFLINASIVLAKQVLLTNKIINKNIDALEGKEKLLREMSIKYYKAVFNLNREYEKRKLPR